MSIDVNALDRSDSVGVTCWPLPALTQADAGRILRQTPRNRSLLRSEGAWPCRSYRQVTPTECFRSNAIDPSLDLSRAPQGAVTPTECFRSNAIAPSLDLSRAPQGAAGFCSGVFAIFQHLN